MAPDFSLASLRPAYGFATPAARPEKDLSQEAEHGNGHGHGRDHSVGRAKMTGPLLLK
jgi:hypothetical protein